jgi:uncharacterized protein (DUF3820 family)
MVVESGAVSYRAAQKVKEQLERTGCTILGVVLNRVERGGNTRYGGKYGKYGKYGKVYGFYYRNGERADSSDVESICWCKKNDTEPQEIPNSGCGSWALLSIVGEPTSEPVKVLGLDDVLDFGKYKGKKLCEIIINDWQYIKWAVLGSQRLFVDIEEIVAYHEANMPKLTPSDKMTFGKYKGRSILEVYKEDQQYLRWLEENNSSFRVDWKLFLSLAEPEKSSEQD